MRINPFPTSYLFPARSVLMPGDGNWILILTSESEHAEALEWFGEHGIDHAADDVVQPHDLFTTYTYTTPYIGFSDDEAAFMVRLRWT